MKRYKVLLAIALLVVVAIASVLLVMRNTTDDTDEKKTQVSLYFLNEQHNTIVEEKKELSYKNINELPNLVIQNLIKGPSDSKRMRILDKRTRVNSIKWNGADIMIDFSDEYLTGESTQDILATYAVVKSLCSVQGVSRVKVTVDGDAITEPGGNQIDFLSDDDINLATDTNSTEKQNVTLYFADKEGLKLREEVRSVKRTDKQPIEQYVVNELIKGPVGKELLPTLSADTTVISVETKEGICFVNLKASFLDKNSGNANKEQLAVYSIVNSLTELPNINSVQFLIDGKKTDTFGQFGFSEPFTRNNHIIGEQEPQKTQIEENIQPDEN